VNSRLLFAFRCSFNFLYVPVFLASIAACRFSDIDLCPIASLENPIASFPHPLSLPDSQTPPGPFLHRKIIITKLKTVQEIRKNEGINITCLIHNPLLI
jgi:hypothetical protein